MWCRFALRNWFFLHFPNTSVITVLNHAFSMIQSRARERNPKSVTKKAEEGYVFEIYSSQFVTL